MLQNTLIYPVHYPVKKLKHDYKDLEEMLDKDALAAAGFASLSFTIK